VVGTERGAAGTLAKRRNIKMATMSPEEFVRQVNNTQANPEMVAAMLLAAKLDLVNERLGVISEMLQKIYAVQRSLVELE
jgi:hypothetical protein